MKRFVLLTLALLMVLTALCACDTEVGVPVDPTDSPSSSQSGQQIGTLADYVKTAKEATQSFGDGNTTTYRLPEILLDSSDANAANSEIMATYGEFCKEYDDYSPVISMDYEAFLNDKYLSVIVTSSVDGGNSTGLCYSFDVTTGDQLDNETLCSMTGRDYNTAVTTLTENLTAEYDTKYASLPSNEEMRSQTLSSDNIEKSKMYLDGSGKLQSLVDIYAAVGGGHWVNSFAAE